jgi:probable rRNA maturation factor
MVSRGGPRLSVELRNAARAPVDRAIVRRVAIAVLAGAGASGRHRLSVHVVDDDAIRSVNCRQRGIDSPTDVLSFPLSSSQRAGAEAFALPPGEPNHLGDVLISYERVVAQANEYGHSVEREFYYLLAHGVLHLLGFDHQEESERREMRKREEQALAPLELTR